MAPNAESWTAFNHFQHADTDYTFRRSPGACSQEQGAQSKLASVCGRARSAPPRPMSSEGAWCFHHRAVHGDETEHRPKLGCRSAAESGYDKVTSEMACNLFNCTGFEGRPMSKRRPGQFSSQTGMPVPRSDIAAIFQMRGVCDIDHNLRRGPGLGQGTTVGNEQRFSEEKEIALKRSLSSLSVREVRPEIPEFLCDLACLGIECRRLATASVNHRESQKRFAREDASSTLETSSLLSKQRLTPVLSRPRQVKHDRSASHNRLGSDWLGTLDCSNINTRRLVAAYSSAAQRPKLSRPRVNKSEDGFSTECFAPQDCTSVGATCSTIDEDEDIASECQAIACSQGIVIPELAMHRLEAARKDNGACLPSFSSSSTVGSAEGSSIDGDSDCSGSESGCCTPPPTPTRSISFVIV